jgi:transcriptional regulator with XRE-family HTH domain
VSPFRPRFAVVEDVRRALGRRVRALRDDLNLSQEKLAERAGLHWTHISGIERGQWNIGLSTICKVARGLGVSLSDLFAGVELRSRPRKGSH